MTAEALALPGVPTRAATPFSDSLHQFAQNRLALVSAGVVVLFVLLALTAPWLAPHDPNAADLFRRLQPPGWMRDGDWAYPLGCDQLGRDILSRLIYGARVSIFVGATVILIATSVGILAGLAAGYLRGWADTVISRLVDILLGFPYLIFAIGLMAMTGPGLSNMILALAYKEWVIPCRVVRGETLAAREMDYVEAARAIGASSRHIMLREILPNILSPVVVIATIRMANVIILEASLSFLGLGVQPPTASWGAHGRRRARLPARRLVGQHPARACHPRARARDQRRGPGAARRVRSAVPRMMLAAASAPARPAPAPAAPPLLCVRGLKVVFPTRNGVVTAVNGVDLDVLAGECLGVVGESGSGKSVTFASVVGLRPPARPRHSRARSGSQGAICARCPPPRSGHCAGSDIALTMQDALTALNPALTVGEQITEVLMAHGAPAVRPHRQAAGAGARARTDDPGRHSGAGRTPRRLSAPVLRRDAPAHHDRDRAGLPPAAC